MTSIRTRLITILIGTTGLVWLLAVAWIYLSTQAEVERVLDARLTEAARMVNSLLTDHRIEIAMAEGLGEMSPKPDGEHQPYGRQLSCQIWSLDGMLVGRSESAPHARLTEAKQGFSETEVDGETWRVYTVENPQLGVRVMIGDSVRIRDKLVGDVIKGLVLPAALILPFLVGMIWLSVRRGLSPLNDMAGALSARMASDLRPLPNTDMPKEIAPAINALNGLFRRVAEARERERGFTAFAAHELKTPLAGLKTQAQIALGSGDGEVHANALRQITAGVDRTSRLVRQLLDLAALEASDDEPALTPENPARLLSTVLADVSELARSRGVTIEFTDSGDDLEIMVELQFFLLALRNLLENAINHSPKEGTVTCRVVTEGDQVQLVVEDEGSGVPEAELPRVTERFFRGRNRSATGSGLGLAIAQTAMERIGGQLRLQNRRPRGLTAVLVVSAHGNK
jgi:two-component system sensor histidine kinase QseC